MQVFKSKNDVTIEAFQFKGSETKAPDWFYDYFHKGDVQITIGMHNKRDCITIYQRGEEKKVFTGDWLCRNNQDTLYKLTDEEINDGFKKVFDL